VKRDRRRGIDKADPDIVQHHQHDENQNWRGLLPSASRVITARLA